MKFLGWRHADLVHCRLVSVASICVVALFAGCTPEPPVKLVRLDVSASGEYLLEGKLIERHSLANALVQQKRPGERLGMYLRPAEHADAEAVAFAIEEAKRVGVSTGMVGSEVSYPSSESNSPRP